MKGFSAFPSYSFSLPRIITFNSFTFSFIQFSKSLVIFFRFCPHRVWLQKIGMSCIIASQRLWWFSVFFARRNATRRIHRIFHEGVSRVGLTGVKEPGGDGWSVTNTRSTPSAGGILDILLTQSGSSDICWTVSWLRGDSRWIPRRRAPSDEGFPWDANLGGPLRPIRNRESRVIDMRGNTCNFTLQHNHRLSYSSSIAMHCEQKRESEGLKGRRRTKGEGQGGGSEDARFEILQKFPMCHRAEMLNFNGISLPASLFCNWLTFARRYRTTATTTTMAAAAAAKGEKRRKTAKRRNVASE